jgi:hypothetical protein
MQEIPLRPHASRRFCLLRPRTGPTVENMWDTVQPSDAHVSHDLPCLHCGHAAHVYLACDAACGCEPVGMPGAAPLALASR